MPLTECWISNLMKVFWKLNAKQKASILEGKAGQKAGKILSEKKANKQIQEWLTK